MGLISEIVNINITSNTVEFYETKGYKIEKYINAKGGLSIKRGTKLDVKVSDLPLNSHVLVNIKCDCKDCEKLELLARPFKDYNVNVHEDGKYYCSKCASRLFGKNREIQARIKNGKSFEEWCYEKLDKKEAEDILNRWDYDKNQYSPSEITFCSKGFEKKGYWFKCLEHIEHGSELKNIKSFVHGHKNSITCNKCNSFAQWGIDNICQKFLEEYWDYDNNKNINPWEVTKCSETKIFIKCQNNIHHGSYDLKAYTFTSINCRCPICNQSKGENNIEEWFEKHHFIKGKNYIS